MKTPQTPQERLDCSKNFLRALEEKKHMLMEKSDELVKKREEWDEQGEEHDHEVDNGSHIYADYPSPCVIIEKREYTSNKKIQKLIDKTSRSIELASEIFEKWDRRINPEKYQIRELIEEQRDFNALSDETGELFPRELEFEEKNLSRDEILKKKTDIRGGIEFLQDYIKNKTEKTE